jgi:hypothetical protein
MSLLFLCFIVFNIKKIKINKLGEKMQIFFFFFILIAFHVLYVFLPNILVHGALIEYAYI